MESLKELYRIGHGPSSSHTMGPREAIRRYLADHEKISDITITLYGSLALTGKGHMTDVAVIEEAKEHGSSCKVYWEPETVLPGHPNGMMISSEEAGDVIYYSVGGGKVLQEGESLRARDVYPHSSMREVLSWCEERGRTLWEYVSEFEDPDIFDFLEEIWDGMRHAVSRGLEHEGVLPGGLNLPRKAAQYYAKAQHFSGPMGKRSMVYSYALAVSEENASGGRIVTAPTCGSCGVLPAVLRYQKEIYKIPKVRILRALATAGVIGSLVKRNASISGAEVGCQGEIGTACAMASGACAQLMGGTVHQIEYAAEMGLEHHLGLTCDPIGGLVQIPCIERNALASVRALNHMSYALLSDGRHRVSFDAVVSVMKETGDALPSLYRETSQGGLAKIR